MSDEPLRELNLASHRTPPSVWHRRGGDDTLERRRLSGLLVGAGAAALAVQAVRGRSWRNLVLAGVGSALAWWAVTGKGGPVTIRRWVADVFDQLCGNRADAVLEASQESFPASDPPAWTPTIGTGRR